MTTFSWSIVQLERYEDDGIVFIAHYAVNANNGLYSAEAYGSVNLEHPNPDAIIPYNSLTPEIVINWVKDKLGGTEKVDEIQTALQAQIDEQQSPSRASGLPWE
jgi:hypothetical protein